MTFINNNKITNTTADLRNADDVTLGRIVLLLSTVLKTDCAINLVLLLTQSRPHARLLAS
jgi:hypothetical protein